jgi:hypothetical protein
LRVRSGVVDDLSCLQERRGEVSAVLSIPVRVDVDVVEVGEHRLWAAAVEVNDLIDPDRDVADSDGGLVDAEVAALSGSMVRVAQAGRVRSSWGLLSHQAGHLMVCSVMVAVVVMMCALLVGMGTDSPHLSHTDRTPAK